MTSAAALVAARCVPFHSLRASRPPARPPVGAAQGLLIGLTQYTTKAHVARAMLEAICYQTREVLEAMEKDVVRESDGGGHGLRVTALRVDGGASKNNLLMQMQADVLGKLVIRPPDVETTARGAALAAGLAQGLFTHESIFEHKSARVQPAPFPRDST